MKYFLFALLFTGVLPVTAGDLIPVKDEEIKLLGIELASPKAAQDKPGSLLAAMVVIPPGHEQIVSVPEAARIQSMHVASGDEVQKSQPLAVLASPALLSLQKDYLQARADLNLAGQQLNRDKQLAAEGIIAKRRLQETQASYANERLRVNQQASALRIAGFSDEDITALKRNGKLQDSITLRASQTGIVLEKMARIGERLEAGAPLFRIADLSALWLEIRVPLATAGSLTKGQAVKVDAREVTGNIQLIGKNVDPETQTLLARAEITTGLDKIRPGEALNVRLLASSATDGQLVFEVERVAVIQSGDNAYVFVRMKGGFEARKVEVTGYAGKKALITGDLSTDDQIAKRGLAALKAAWLGMSGDE